METQTSPKKPSLPERIRDYYANRQEEEATRASAEKEFKEQSREQGREWALEAPIEALDALRDPQVWQSDRQPEYKKMETDSLGRTVVTTQYLSIPDGVDKFSFLSAALDSYNEARTEAGLGEISAPHITDADPLVHAIAKVVASDQQHKKEEAKAKFIAALGKEKEPPETERIRATTALVRAVTDFKNVSKISVEFNGGGDNGWIESVATDREFNLLQVAPESGGKTYHDVIEQFCYAFLEEVGLDWCNGGGGYGEITIDLGTRTATCDINIRMEPANSQHKLSF
jgi:hypothetical protein